MKAILTGGGTGGHIYPALSVGLDLKKQGWKILYIGSKNSWEKKLIVDKGLRFKAINVAPLPRKLTLKLIISILKSLQGFFQARHIIKKFQPDVIFGTGGFVAGPVVEAGSLSGYPTIIHEQNVYPGITNRLLSYTVDKVALNFKEAIDYFPGKVAEKSVVTGNPVRKSILETSREQGLANLGLDNSRKTLLVFGGSQGARTINQAMFKVCEYFQQKSWLQIIYITGKDKYDKIIEEFKKRDLKLDKINNIKIMPYLHNMEWAYAIANLIVYRAGATGLAEITARGIPAILVPYPYATGNHQEYNAQILEKHGAAIVVSDTELTGDLLIDKIKELIVNEKLLVKMKKNSKKMGQPKAVDNLVSEIKALVNEQ